MKRVDGVVNQVTPRNEGEGWSVFVITKHGSPRSTHQVVLFEMMNTVPHLEVGDPVLCVQRVGRPATVTFQKGGLESGDVPVFNADFQ